MVVKTPHKIPELPGNKYIFLAGSIEMGKAENWQEKVENAFLKNENIVLLNPRRDDWNADWKQEKENAQFSEQVNWELNAMERADVIVMYFSPGTMSPVTLLELGLHANSGKLIVCCPEGFWRRGNVDIVCENHGITQVGTLDGLITLAKQKIETLTIEY